MMQSDTPFTYHSSQRTTFVLSPNAISCFYHQSASGEHWKAARLLSWQSSSASQVWLLSILLRRLFIMRSIRGLSQGLAFATQPRQLRRSAPRQALPRSSSVAASFDAQQSATPRTFTNYSIYKGKAALQCTFVPPTMEALKGGSLTSSRDGALLLTFAAAVGERTYDWNQKQIFALGVGEMGNLLATFGHGQPTRSLDMLHDPGKGSQSEGAVIKKMTIAPLGGDGSVMVNLNVTQKSADAVRLAVPVSPGEMEVLCSIARYCIPRALGFDRIV